MNEFLTVKQASKLYRVNRKSILSEIENGSWGSIKIKQGFRVNGWRIFKPPTFDPAMTPKDLSRIMGVSHRIVQKWCSDGTVKAFKVCSVWRIFYDDGAKLILKRQFGFRREN